MKQPVRQVLADKQRGGAIDSVSADTSVARAVRQMNELGIGSLGARVKLRAPGRFAGIRWLPSV